MSSGTPTERWQALQDSWDIECQNEYPMASEKASCVLLQTILSLVGTFLAKPKEL